MRPPRVSSPTRAATTRPPRSPPRSPPSSRRPAARPTLGEARAVVETLADVRRRGRRQRPVPGPVGRAGPRPRAPRAHGARSDPDLALQLRPGGRRAGDGAAGAAAAAGRRRRPGRRDRRPRHDLRRAGSTPPTDGFEMEIMASAGLDRRLARLRPDPRLGPRDRRRPAGACRGDRRRRGVDGSGPDRAAGPSPAQAQASVPARSAEEARCRRRGRRPPGRGARRPGPRSRRRASRTRRRRPPGPRRPPARRPASASSVEVAATSAASGGRPPADAAEPDSERIEVGRDPAQLSRPAGSRRTRAGRTAGCRGSAKLPNVPARRLSVSAIRRLTSADFRRDARPVLHAARRRRRRGRPSSSSDAAPLSSVATMASRWRSTLAIAGSQPVPTAIVAPTIRIPATRPTSPYAVSPTPIARRRRCIISIMDGSYRPREDDDMTGPASPRRGGLVIGLVLILLGGAALLVQAGGVSIGWPIWIIVPGVALILGRRRRGGPGGAAWPASAASSRWSASSWPSRRPTTSTRPGPTRGRSWRPAGSASASPSTASLTRRWDDLRGRPRRPSVGRRALPRRLPLLRGRPRPLRRPLRRT